LLANHIDETHELALLSNCGLRYLEGFLLDHINNWKVSDIVVLEGIYVASSSSETIDPSREPVPAAAVEIQNVTFGSIISHIQI